MSANAPPLPPRRPATTSTAPPVPARPTKITPTSLPTPAELIRAENRLSFPPAYSIVGIYRLFTDVRLRSAVWAKCKHGTVRGAAVGAGWIFVSWRVQLGFVERFLMGSKRVLRYKDDTVIFGHAVPLAAYATIFIISSQFWYILKFFLSKNIRIAKERAWNQTVESRAKPAEFWGPYVEEWVKPPVDEARHARKRARWEKRLFGWAGRFVLHKFILFPLNFVPFLGLVISSAVKALGIARYLHQPYFASKKMSPEQIEIFIEERKWDYYAFGFTSALLESIPFIGLVFSITNRIGAAMWAFDLEKRQDAFRRGKLQPEETTKMEVLPGLGSLGRVNVRSEMGGTVAFPDEELKVDVPGGF